MVDSDANQPAVASRVGKTNPWKVFGIAVIAVAALILSFWLVKTYLFPSAFKPVALSAKEEGILNQKLGQLNLPALSNSSSASPKRLTPEAYSESNARREVAFSEREVNAIVAHKSNMADKLAIDFSDNLASVKLLLPLDPDMPVMGGQTLSLHAGIEFNFVNGKPVVKLKGVSAWGVPVPNAWLGNLKNVDLVDTFGESEGFWKAFSDGIDYIKVSDGKLLVKLRE